MGCRKFPDFLRRRRERGTITGGETRKAAVSTDPFDVELEDPELLDEVGLTASLMVAANQSEGPLSAEEIDRLLGLR